MRYVLILAAIAAAGFAYKRSRAEPPPAVEVQGDKTPAANAEKPREQPLGPGRRSILTALDERPVGE